MKQLATLVLAASTAFADPPVKGNDVKSIIYLKGGKVGGLMSQAAGKTWREDNDDGRFVFKELARDEWSVYLLKKDGP